MAVLSQSDRRHRLKSEASSIGVYPTLLPSIMGIKGAWETFEHAAIVEPLTELCLRNGGFSDLSNNSPEYVLGVDANNVLSRALSPVLGERGLARRHWAREARSSDLIGAITSLAGYFNSPCTVVFVFDGPLKSDMKRDKAIVPRDPRVIKNYKRLLNVLGFNIWEALGEADADLGIMSKFGLANSVLSDDSDLFVLGARTVLRTRRNDCGLDDRVACYRAVNIRRHGTCGLDATQLVLLAILVGNEYEPVSLGYLENLVIGPILCRIIYLYRPSFLDTINL